MSSQVHLKEEQPQSITIDVEGITRLIPHRYPMLLVDRLVNVIPGESATGLKCVTANEWFFPGHFPKRPVMPGVLIIECMAQTAGTLVMYTLNSDGSKLVYFMSIEDARFRKPVVPGDMLQVHVKKIQHRGPVWKFKGEAYVGDVLVAEATYSAMIMDQKAE